MMLSWRQTKWLLPTWLTRTRKTMKSLSVRLFTETWMKKINNNLIKEFICNYSHHPKKLAWATHLRYTKREMKTQAWIDPILIRQAAYTLLIACKRCNRNGSNNFNKWMTCSSRNLSSSSKIIKYFSKKQSNLKRTKKTKWRCSKYSKQVMIRPWKQQVQFKARKNLLFRNSSKRVRSKPNLSQNWKKNNITKSQEIIQINRKVTVV